MSSSSPPSTQDYVALEAATPSYAPPQKVPWYRRREFFISIGVVVFLGALAVILFAIFHKSSSPVFGSCGDISPPYLYMTYHGGPKSNTINQISRFTMTGCHVNYVLDDSGSNLHMLRSILLLADGRLLVANAYESESKIVILSNCSATGTRSVVGTFVARDMSKNPPVNPSLEHPYGLATDGTVVFVSNQDTNTILRYDMNGNPLQTAAYLAGTANLQQGTLVQLKVGGNGVRSIAYDKPSNSLWFTDGDTNKVWRIQDPAGNAAYAPEVVQSLNSPIGMFLTDDTVFVGQNPSHGSLDAVQAIDLPTRSPKRSYKHKSLSHPAGIVAYNNTVYVVSQATRSIVTFSQATGKFSNVIVSGLSDDPEQLFLSPC